MSSNETAILAAGIGATLQLIRLSSDLISAASQKDAKVTEVLDKATPAEIQSRALNRRGSTRFFDGRMSMSFRKKAPDSKPTALVVDGSAENVSEEPEDDPTITLSAMERFTLRASLAFTALITVYFIVIAGLTDGNSNNDIRIDVIYDTGPCACAAVATALSLIYQIRDRLATRFSMLQRTLHVFSAVILALSVIFRVTLSSEAATATDIVSIVLLTLWAALALILSKVLEWPDRLLKEKKAHLSMAALMTVMKPYVWPDATATSATMNRIRAISTWMFVGASKACSLIAPIYLGRASTALARSQWEQCIYNIVWYSLLTFGSALFKEAQSLVYLRVAQVAFVQLAELSFSHLHSLSLDWHLQKKLGEVLRSMSRGIQACDTLIKYLFLWLVPAIVECILVAVIFALYFDDLVLAATVFFFVFAYMVLTVLLTLWRKKFRKQVAKSDNDWNDVATDSLINFETVKFFTAEEFEKEKFATAVEAYQKGSVNVAASLSTLNISQKLLLQACMATALSLVVLSVRDRANCCIANGCDGGETECCENLSQVCTGMEIGDFVSVLTYTLQLFAPLGFLGSVYNAIVMAVVDLRNLSELLSESPDVTDGDDAVDMPATNAADPDTVIEFDNVKFHYPSQPETSGLKGVSFKMKKGTTTAIVGSTGAGKTTISRLLFRFYDVTGGSVKCNGVDLRKLKQKALRGKIGVVPQAAVLFNDTLGKNLLYGRQDATQADLDEAIEAAQLTTFIASLPLGLETMVGDRGLKLSGGEKQRTAIARCILKNPSICVFDEATSALDTLTEQSVKEALDRLGSDRTVLVIAHRLGTIRNADQIIVLKDGLINEQGTHEELLSRGGQYADMWNMQLDSTKASSNSLANKEGDNSTS